MGPLQKALLASLQAERRIVFPSSSTLAGRHRSGFALSLRSSQLRSRCVQDSRESSPVAGDSSRVAREFSFHPRDPSKVVGGSPSSGKDSSDVEGRCANYSAGPGRGCAFSMKNLCGDGSLARHSHADSLLKRLNFSRSQNVNALDARKMLNPWLPAADSRCFSVGSGTPVTGGSKGTEEGILPSTAKKIKEAREEEEVEVRARECSDEEMKGEGRVSTVGSSSVGHLGKPGLGQKPRMVVLGTGWAASRLMKDLDPTLCDIVCISPRNHMVFTPLLASTCVGTLEFRSVAEPVVRIQSALSKSPHSYFFLGHCHNVDVHNHQVHCITEEEGLSPPMKTKSFTIAYDKLIIASGAQALTFNIHGVNDHAIFLREVSDAQAIRKKLLLNLMLSDIPGTTDEEKKRLLHCVVVGGGPTGVEFSGELSDFISRDVRQRYAHVQDYIHVTLIEAKEILSSFDLSLRLYAIKHLTKAGVKLVTGIVKDVQPGKLILSDDSEVPYGLLVWSTGVGPSGFVKSLDLPKSSDGRIGIDERLKVPGVEDVFAIGDCAGYVESVGKPVLPALAQVAERQGKYLGKELNRILKLGGGPAGKMGMVPEGPPFVYRHLGSMASVGSYKALVDLRKGKESRGFSWAGFISWLVWRSAYLTRVVSWRNRFYVAVNWATTFVFGRDISRL